MLRLSKKVEYALLALQHTTCAEGEVCTVKAMAERYSISFELLAKVMSTLSKNGIVQSIQGVNGGFVLARPAHEISIRSVIRAVEGDRAQLIECGSHDQGTCSIEDSCTIKHPLLRLQHVIDSALESMSVAELSPKHSRTETFVPLLLTQG